MRRVVETAYLKPISQLRFNYDTTTTRLRRKMTCSFFARVESRRMEDCVRAIRRSRIVVVS